MFSDGITEARNTEGEEFGIARLLAAMEGNLARNAEEVRGQILDALKNHSRGVSQSDDVTLIVAHVLGTWVANG
jgi:sigma-B regulation protein RsbU (phosphoserine phosphatase)